MITWDTFDVLLLNINKRKFDTSMALKYINRNEKGRFVMEWHGPTFTNMV